MTWRLGRHTGLATDPIEFLKVLALRGADRDFVAVTSSQLAEALDVSQQTASRKILELLNRDLIDRRLGARVQLIRVTDGGMEALREIYEEYRAIFETPSEVVIHGTAESGIGKGKEFLGKPGYTVQIHQRLGFEPYPGTLNVRVPERERPSLYMLRNRSGIPIEGFQAEERDFGGATCFPALIQEEDCAVILPDRSGYRDILEVISPKHLRSALAIDDGDEVRVRVMLGEVVERLNGP